VITFSWRRAGSVVLRQIYLIRGSLARILPLFAWVATDMVLWGFLTRYLNTVTRSGMDFVPTLLGAVLLWDFFSRVMQGVTMAFLEDVWSRNFLNLFASPLSITEYVAGLVASSIMTSAVGLLVMIALASGIFGLSFLSYGLLLFPFVLILFLFGIAIGVVASAIVLWFGPASEWFVWPIPALIAPFAGVFYPVATLPRWMQGIAAVLPPASVFDSLRRISAGGAAPIGSLAWSAGLALVYLLLATWLFARVHRHAVRVGLIARYSAETLS
jgi:ABC-2 type transport system permease protein